MKNLNIAVILTLAATSVQADTFNRWHAGGSNTSGNFYATVHSPQDVDYQFMLSSNVEDCTIKYASLVLNNMKEAEEGFVKDVDVITYRVGEHAPIRGVYSMNRMTDYMMFPVSNWMSSNASELLSQIKSGVTLRVKIDIDENKFYASFPLKGSRKAIDRMNELCLEASSKSVGNSNADYFEEYDL